MSLETLKLPFYVTTSEHEPVADFFDPVLEHAQKYDIAVGYFSSAWMRDAAMAWQLLHSTVVKPGG